MKDWKLMLFIPFCIRCGLEGCLNLTSQQLIRLHEECLVMAEYIEDCATQAMVNISLGELCRKTEKFTEAIEYFERALVIAVERNNIFHKASAYVQLGLTYNSLGNSTQGLLYVEKCLAIAINTGMKWIEGNAYRYLGIIYQFKGEYQTAINCFEKELAISEELDDNACKGCAYYQLGSAYWSQNMLEEAKKWYEKYLPVISIMNDKEIEKTVYGRLGTIYHSSGKHDMAIRYYEKLLHLVKDNNDAKTSVYGKLGEAYKSLGKDDEAIKYYTKQLVLVETMDCKEEIKRAHLNLGAVYFSMEKYFDEIKHLKKLLTISIKTGDKEMQSFAYGHLGICSISVSDFDKAIAYNKEMLKIALETDSKDVEMKAYMGMADTSHALREYDKAICYLQKALSIAEELEDKSSKGLVYGKIATVFSSLDEYDKALKYYLEALSIARETGNKEHELVSHENLGNIYSHFGKFHESLQCHERVLDLRRETGYSRCLQVAYGNIGNLYNGVGNCDNALKHFQFQLNLCQNKGDREGKGTAYRNLSNVYIEQGKYQEAMDCSKRSLKIAQEIGDKKGEGDSFNRLGHDYLKQDKDNEALKCFERSLVIAKEIGSKKVEINAHFSLGGLYFKYKGYAKAFDHYEKALRLAVLLGDKRNEQTACYNLGCLYLVKAYTLREMCDVNQMCMKQCKKHLEQSLQCSEWMFDHLHDRDNIKITIMDTFIKNYNLLAHVLIETEEIDEALILSDRGRARALSDLLAMKYSQVPQHGKNVILTYAEVDSVFHASKNEFHVLYLALQFHTVAIWVLGRQKPPFFLAVNAQGFEHTQLPTIQGYDGSKIISELVFAAYDATNVRNVLRCEDRSLDHLPESVQLIKSDDCLVRGDGQKDGDNSAPDQNEREMAPNREKNVEGNTNPLEMLYSKLIAPVMQNLTHEDMVIVPDGLLHMVPFAALRDPETGLFLSEMKRIRLVPSLTTLKSLQECPSDYYSKTGALVVGDPDSGAVMFQGKETTFSPLPEARREATVIGNILGVKPLLGAQATKDFIKQRLHEGVAVIHIAAHGSTKGEIVLAPGTLTGARKIPEEEDYLLTMQEVQETGIRAQLVVLSCCHSGRGEIRAEGIVGISRGFLAAGARAVVASLWAIDDEATLNFMVSFYTFLKMGESASKSLQQAMKDLREDEDYKEPRHWAPFFLIGDDVTINFQK